MLKRVDVAVYDTIEEFTERRARGRPGRSFDLANDGVGYSTTGGHVDEIAGQLEELKQQIIDGEIDGADDAGR